VRALRGWLLACAVAPAWASHPLLTEDTDVLGAGQWELELHGERARDRESGVTTRATEIVAKAARGVAKDLHLEAELPYAREKTEGDIAQGRGDALVSLKWRFYQQDRLSLAFKPDVILPTGRDEHGLGAGRTGWAANLTAGYELGRAELLGHLGYTRNRNRIGEREDLRHVSAALRWAATEKLKLVVDVARQTQPEPGQSAARELVYGATYELADSIDLGIGMKEGLSDAADDRSVRMGVKLRF
jgi:hypothetical protein